MSSPYVIAHIARVMRAIPEMPDHAGAVHAAVMEALQADGFHVEHEAPIVFGGRSGRIDIVARRWGSATAIEIDARRPRGRSLDKLRAFNGGRIVALRGVSGPPWLLHDIDAVVPLRVRMLGSIEERDDSRRAVGRSVRRRRIAA